MKKIKQWLQDWSTSKTTLFLAITMVIFYTLIDIIIGIVNANTGTILYLDSTLTSEWFEFWKWVVAGSGSVSIFKLLNLGKDKNITKTAKKIKKVISEDNEEVKG